MSKTIKDVLALAASKLGQNSALQKAIEAEDITKVTFADDEYSAIQGAIGQLLTPDAALNNPDLITKFKDSVHPQLKKSIYEFVENELKEVGGKFGVKFEEGEQAKDMLKKLKELELPKPKPGEDTAKYQQEIDNLQKQMAKLREEKENEIGQLKNTWEAQRRDQVITQALSKFKLAEPYEKELVKKGIFETVKNELYSKAVVKVGQNNEIELFQKDMPDKYIYTESNKRMTFDDFVTPLVQDFVKKSEPNKPNPPGLKPENKKPDAPADSMAAYLAEQRAKVFNS